MIDYDAPAEVYAIRQFGAKRRMTFRQFSTTAEALQFAIEELPAKANVVLEIDEDRFDGASILEMYEAEAYPLVRTARRAPLEGRPR